MKHKIVSRVTDPMDETNLTDKTERVNRTDPMDKSSETRCFLP